MLENAVFDNKLKCSAEILQDVWDVTPFKILVNDNKRYNEPATKKQQRYSIRADFSEFLMWRLKTGL